MKSNMKIFDDKINELNQLKKKINDCVSLIFNYLKLVLNL